MKQRAISIACSQDSMIGILAVPAQPLSRGVLVITGGPQYRVGSHRQFVLLARHLAQQGIPVMRFDQRGMGDSEGSPRNFEDIEQDIGCALAAFFAAQPQLTEVVLWGLCDGATAASFHAPGDPRVCALILLNPWVRTQEGQARATLRHYYFGRLLQADFWKKLAGGGLRPLASIGSILSQLRQASAVTSANAGTSDSLPQRVMLSLARFGKPIMIVLSGDDLTAREFANVLARSTLHCKRVDIPDANHTLSRQEWRDHMANICSSWITSW
jgi:exosortase A-associated hydrolase 1